MARLEQYAWVSLVANGLIFFVFQHRMLDGWSVAELTPTHMFATYIGVIIAVIAFESVVAGVQAAQDARAPDRVVEDERDVAIKAKANNLEHWTIAIAINVLIFQLLADLAFPGHVFPRIDLTRPEAIFFVLIAALFLAHFVKLAAIVASYRL